MLWKNLYNVAAQTFILSYFSLCTNQILYRMTIMLLGSHARTIQLFGPVFNFMSSYCTVESQFLNER